jgi:hypothetical protein
MKESIAVPEGILCDVLDWWKVNSASFLLTIGLLNSTTSFLLSLPQKLFVRVSSRGPSTLQQLIQWHGQRMRHLGCLSWHDTT